MSKSITDSGECAVHEWLLQIGYRTHEIEHCKDGRDPPDFIVKRNGRKIAVEVRRLPELEKSDEWHKIRHAIGRAMKKLVREASEQGHHWTATLEYDERQSPDVMYDGLWKERVKKYLCSSEESLRQISMRQQRHSNYDVDEYDVIPLQIAPICKVQGRGVVLELTPSRKGYFSDFTGDDGCQPLSELGGRVIAAVDEKSSKVRSKASAGCYDEWWLVFVDQVLMFYEVLGEAEIATIAASVSEGIDRDLWSKVVLVSPAKPKPVPEVQHKSSWVLWEDSRHPSIEALASGRFS